jgi:tetratricopeptide (TPR) repeat protein
LRIANAIEWLDASREGLNWLQKGMALIPQGSLNFNLLRANTLTNMAPLLINNGNSQSAIEILKESMELYKSINPADKRGWVNTLIFFAYGYMDSDYIKARAYAQESVAMARELGESGKWDLAWALYWDGWIASRQTEYENAKSQIQEGLAIFRQVGDNISAADMLHLMGRIEAGMENYDVALKYYYQAQDMKLEYDLKTSALFVLNDISSLERRLGNYEAARIKIETCIIYLRDRGDQYNLAGSLQQLGDVLINLGETSQSTTHLRESLQILQHKEAPRYKGYCLFSLAKSLKLQGRVNEAALLLGAIEVETSKDLWQLFAPRKADYDQTYEEIKTALGKSEFASDYAEGKAMTLDQGVAYALEISND